MITVGTRWGCALCILLLGFAGCDAFKPPTKPDLQTTNIDAGTEAESNSLFLFQRFGGLQVGDVASSFKLPSYDGKSQTDLDNFIGKKPIILVFGSFT